jgi:hypothetical protein
MYQGYFQFNIYYNARYWNLHAGKIALLNYISTCSDQCIQLIDITLIEGSE